MAECKVLLAPLQPRACDAVCSPRMIGLGCMRCILILLLLPPVARMDPWLEYQPVWTGPTG